MKAKKLTILGLVSIALLSGCGSKKMGKEVEDTKKVEETSKVDSKKEHQIDYKDQKNWDFESGNSQSPINIDSTAAEPMQDEGKIELNYNNNVNDEVDNGHSIQVDDGGTAMIDGRQFELTQFHFHSKSEHTLNGEHFPIEVHFVNKAQDGHLAVIAVFFKEGKENAGFQKVLNNVKKDKKTNVEESMNITDMIPTNKTYYHYVGSLTTPPLSENVEWYVMENPIEVSQSQITKFNEFYEGNNRELQKLNDRSLLKHTE